MSPSCRVHALTVDTCNRCGSVSPPPLFLQTREPHTRCFLSTLNINQSTANAVKRRPVPNTGPTSENNHAKWPQSLVNVAPCCDKSTLKPAPNLCLSVTSPCRCRDPGRTLQLTRTPQYMVLNPLSTTSSVSWGQNKLAALNRLVGQINLC